MLDLTKNDPGGSPAKMTERAPGVFVAVDPKAMGKMCLARWRNNGNGTHSLVPVTNQLVVLNDKLLQRLGMKGGRHTIMRLARAHPPFIKVIQRAPRLNLLDLDSLEAHDQRVLAAQAEGREFWTGENLRRYQAARQQEG